MKSTFRFLRKFVLTALLLTVSSASLALIIPNPAPGFFGDDIGGSGLFQPTGSFTIHLELLDLGAVVGIGGSEFGFFYASDPGTLTPIFDPLDENPDPGGPGDIIQLAFLDFDLGVVKDVDAGVLQSTFTSIGPAAIGFYLTLDPMLEAIFGIGTIFSVGNLNPGGEDMAAYLPFPF